MIENFCHLPVSNDLLGNNLINILKENSTIIPENNLNITEEFQKIVSYK